jgi:hypothetical protein
LDRSGGRTSIDELRRRLKERNTTIARLREELRRERAGRDPADASRVIWIFCSPRTGSTWLARMLGEFGGMWDEPAVGALFGEFFYERYPHRRGGRFLMAERYRDAWLPAIRDMVLRGAAARWDGEGYLTIKEPQGSVGAPLLVEALPESRVVLLVRDPRDVVASAYDAARAGSWGAKRLPEWMRSEEYDFCRVRARRNVWDLEGASEAYRATKSPRAIVRYEDLHRDTLGELSRLARELELPVGAETLSAAVERHAWDAVPDEAKGSGKIFRKAAPGSWGDDLTPEQVRIVERESAPIFEAFYEGTPTPLPPPDHPRVQSARARELGERIRLLLGKTCARPHETD